MGIPEPMPIPSPELKSYDAYGDDIVGVVAEDATPLFLDRVKEEVEATLPVPLLTTLGKTPLACCEY